MTIRFVKESKNPGLTFIFNVSNSLDTTSVFGCCPLPDLGRGIATLFSKTSVRGIDVSWDEPG